MAEERKQVPLIDLAAVLISPILIMMMLGSLVFFLIEVLYAGRYEGRLDYTFFFYVIGCVLIARISIRFGAQRAAMYTVFLGGACFVAMLAFVEYPTPLLRVLGPVINIGLMALVWWAASKLTWDCTHLDDDRKSSGRGLLAAAGLDGTKSTTATEDDEEFDPDRSTTATKKKDAKPLGWLERFQKYREWRKKKPHTPGVWVLYFALAALPLFALGQATIASDDDSRRSATFWQMAMYVGSALGLLVTTSLLGLRRYLEDRNARLPTAMTAGWLGLGAALIVAFLACGALLPRPHSETPAFTFKKAGKSGRSASKYDQVGGDSAGKGEGNAGSKTEKGKGNASGKNGEPGGKSGEKNSGGQNKGGSNSGKNSSDKSGGNQGDKGKNSNDNSKSKSGDQSKGDDKGKADDKSGDGGGEDQNKDNDSDDKDGDDKSSSSKAGQITQALEKVATGIKWIVWVVIAIAVVVGAVWFVLKGLSPFTDWARGLLDWFRSLFGAKPKTKAAAQAEEEKIEEEVLRPPPFSMFSNPFHDGTAERREAGELTEYSYAALESWAYENAQGRQPEETPSEFVARLAEDLPEFQVPGQALVKLLMRVLYSPAGPLPGDAKKRLGAFWQVLDAAEMGAKA